LGKSARANRYCFGLFFSTKQYRRGGSVTTFRIPYCVAGAGSPVCDQGEGGGPAHLATTGYILAQMFDFVK
jgi:hypothetical protein